MTTAIPPQPRDATWLERHRFFLKRSKRLRDTAVVFLGDSITERWLGEGRDHWREHFSLYNPLNLGIGGDGVEHLHWRLINGEGDGSTPEVVVMLIGTNNIGNQGQSGETVVELYDRLLNCVVEKWPAATLLVHTVFPRDATDDSDFRREIEKINRALQGWAEAGRFHILDLWDFFLRPDRSIDPEIMPDFLHLSPRAYGMWAAKLKGAIEALRQK